MVCSLSALCWSHPVGCRCFGLVRRLGRTGGCGADSDDRLAAFVSVIAPVYKLGYSTSTRRWEDGCESGPDSQHGRASNVNPGHNVYEFDAVAGSRIG